MTYFRIELVTENQHKLEKATKLGQQLAKDLQITFKEARRYSKFDSSYKLSLAGAYPEDVNPIEFAIEITSKIVTGWETHYNIENKELELIFNKSPYSRFTKQNYNTILWGQFVKA